MLISNGFKPEDAFAIDDNWRRAFCIILEELNSRHTLNPIKYNFVSNIFEALK